MGVTSWSELVNDVAKRLRKLESDLQRIEQQRDQEIVLAHDPDWYGNAERLVELGARQSEVFCKRSVN